MKFKKIYIFLQHRLHSKLRRYRNEQVVLCRINLTNDHGKVIGKVISATLRHMMFGHQIIHMMFGHQIITSVHPSFPAVLFVPMLIHSNPFAQLQLCKPVPCGVSDHVRLEPACSATCWYSCLQPHSVSQSNHSPDLLYDC